MNTDTGEIKRQDELSEKELTDDKWEPTQAALTPLSRTQRVYLHRGVGTGHPGSKRKTSRATIKARRKQGRKGR